MKVYIVVDTTCPDLVNIRGVYYNKKYAINTLIDAIANYCDKPELKDTLHQDLTMLERWEDDIYIVETNVIE